MRLLLVGLFGTQFLVSGKIQWKRGCGRTSGRKGKRETGNTHRAAGAAARVAARAGLAAEDNQGGGSRRHCVFVVKKRNRENKKRDYKERWVVSGKRRWKKGKEVKEKRSVWRAGRLPLLYIGVFWGALLLRRGGVPRSENIWQVQWSTEQYIRVQYNLLSGRIDLCLFFFVLFA